MAYQAIAVAAPINMPSVSLADDPGSAERWAAWRAKGAARDRVARGRMTLALPIAIAVIALVVTVLLGG